MSVPFGRPELPMSVPLDQRNWNSFVWNVIQAAVFVPATVVDNLRVTPQPGGNLIDFTRTDGESYTLYINTTPSINLSTLVELGTSNRYTHAVGIGAVKFWYAVKTNKGNLIGPISFWKSGTTLDLAIPAAAVDPPPATEFPFADQETESVAVTVPIGIGFEPI